jgi:hypothetical protein
MKPSLDGNGERRMDGFIFFKVPAILLHAAQRDKIFAAHECKPGRLPGRWGENLPTGVLRRITPAIIIRWCSWAAPETEFDLPALTFAPQLTDQRQRPAADSGVPTIMLDISVAAASGREVGSTMLPFMRRADVFR